MNLAIVVGNLGKDAETKFTGSGIAVTKFSVATEFRQKNKDTEKWESVTDWHNVVLWRQEGLANLLVKGKKVAVQGRMKTHDYVDKDGVKRYVTEIIADNVELLSPRTDGEKAAAAPSNAPVADDDIPF